MNVVITSTFTTFISSGSSRPGGFWMIPFKTNRRASRACNAEQGFTLTEVLIAGVLVSFSMIGIAKISINALSTGHQQQIRNLIESSINDNMQLIQQADARLTYRLIPTSHKNNQTGSSACLLPGQYLAMALQHGISLQSNWESNAAHTSTQVFASIPAPTSSHGSIQRIIEVDTRNTNITRVIYSFHKPEIRTTSNSTTSNCRLGMTNCESRILELSPNFQSGCPAYSA